MAAWIRVCLPAAAAAAAAGLARVLKPRTKGASAPVIGVERFALEPEPETAPVLDSVLALEKAPRKMPMM